MNSPTPNNLSAYGPADALAKQDAMRRARTMLVNLYEQYCDLPAMDRAAVREHIRCLQLAADGDPICALCYYPLSQHSHDGHYCRENRWFDYSQKFTRAL